MKKINKLFAFVLAFIITAAPFSGMLFEAEAAGEWVSSWATSIVDSAVTVSQLSLQDIIPARSTIRIELKVTTGGEKLRFKFSNEHGAAPITISEASVAKTVGAGGANIKTDTAVRITFNSGNSAVSIPAGATIWSDPVTYHTEALDALSVSLYFANTTYITSAGLSNARTYLGLHNLLREESSQCFVEDIYASREITIGSGTITYHTTPFLAEIDTYVPDGNTDVAVFIGDSTLVNDTYLYFAQKLVNAGIKNVSIVNEAVIGNKLLSDGTGVIGNLYGDALLDRFERDALNISGVDYIFVKIGLNDILHQFSKSMGAQVPHPTAQEIIAGYKTLVERAHAKGIKIYFFTKSPWKGYEREFLGQTGDVVWTREMQDMCDELDKWIMTNNLADGYIDCSPLANPADTDALCPSFTPDGAHLTDIASIALADLIPVSYVGVNNTNIKTAAKINKVDPYKEKNQIIYEMEHPTVNEPEEAPPVVIPPVTDNDDEEDATVPALPGGNEEAPTEPPVVQPPVNDPSTPGYVGNEQVTVPVINGSDSPNYSGLQVSPDYNVSDDLPSVIGNGKNIAFLLILFPVLIGTVLVVYFNMSRKKEEEFEYSLDG